ncbi:hypothetical protein NDU88_005013 [Pleurodeles waltl]|uniref:Uncharacterized protein n=1 Tax=Pleurodeles waltl TaxID=8319 RepID=A0AAV7MI72_PLEWA|nr:hypothetical protein NDU88_005013 [Pleurodeles waltl]
MLQTATGEIQRSREQWAEQRGSQAARVLPAAWCKHRRPEAEPARGITAVIGFEWPGGLVVGCPSFLVTPATPAAGAAWPPFICPSSSTRIISLRLLWLFLHCHCVRWPDASPAGPAVIRSEQLSGWEAWLYCAAHARLHCIVLQRLAAVHRPHQLL